jgi:hypothetical protein
MYQLSAGAPVYQDTGGWQVNNTLNQHTSLFTVVIYQLVVANSGFESLSE